MPYSYRRRSSLPKTPAIYQLQERGVFRWIDQYVGQSKNVHKRWNREGDRRHAHLSLWRRNQQHTRLVIRECWRCNLDYREAVAIQKLKPSLNVKRPKPRWSPMVLVEDAWRSRWAFLVFFFAVALLN